MKKIYSTPEYKRRHHRYIERQKKKRQGNRPYQNSGVQHRVPQKTKIGKRRFLPVKAPEIFSITQSSPNTLRFFDDLWACSGSQTAIYCDMSKIQELTPDAILYLQSQLEDFIEAHPKRKIHGNLPENSEAANLLIESGFFNYVTSRHNVSSKNKNILQMQYGIQVKPPIAKKVVAFVRSCLGLLRLETSPIYTTIIELMKNTFQHAYDTTTNFSRRWWLIAVHLPESASVSFSFLDNGMGIPYTIKKKFSERLTSYIVDRDAELIASTLRGEFRTRTQRGYRGNGLPSIFEHHQNGRIRNLKVLSNKGFVDYAN